MMQIRLLLIGFLILTSVAHAKIVERIDITKVQLNGASVQHKKNYKQIIISSTESNSQHNIFLQCEAGKVSTAGFTKRTYFGSFLSAGPIPTTIFNGKQFKSPTDKNYLETNFDECEDLANHLSSKPYLHLLFDIQNFEMIITSEDNDID